MTLVKLRLLPIDDVEPKQSVLSPHRMLFAAQAKSNIHLRENIEELRKGFSQALDVLTSGLTTDPQGAKREIKDALINLMAAQYSLGMSDGHLSCGRIVSDHDAEYFINSEAASQTHLAVSAVVRCAANLNHVD